MVKSPVFSKLSRHDILKTAALGGLLVVSAAVASLPVNQAYGAGAESLAEMLADMQLAGPGIVDEARLAEAAAESTLGDYLAGNFALDAGNIKEAANYFERALADEPDNLELRRQVFLLDLADARYDAALNEARALRQQEADATNEDAQLLLALDRARAGAFEAVSGELDGITAQGIVALASPFIKAWSLLGSEGTGSLDAAIEQLHSGESLGPLNQFHEAILLAKGERYAEALGKLDDIIPETGVAPVRVAQAYAEILIRDGRRDDALAFLKDQTEEIEQPILGQAIADTEGGGSPELPFDSEAGGMADALLGIAEALEQERGSARAIIYLRLALFLRPDLAQAQLLLGDILASQENSDAAMEVYDAISDTSPLDYAAEVRKAQVLYDQEQHEQAFGLLDDLADTDPERTEALVELGNLLRQDERYERAEKAYSRAIERINAPQPEHWSLFYSRGIAFERTERWKEAEADFLYALELEPEQPFVLNYLGYSWVDQGENLDQAKDMLNRAVAARPEDGFIVDSLGWVHYRLGDYELAVEELERAVELQPGDPVINDHLGDAYWRVGREREATFQWRRALTLEPDDDLVAAIRQKLENGLQDDRS